MSATTARRALTGPPRGFSYVEVLLSATLLAIIGVPAIQSLDQAMRTGERQGVELTALYARTALLEVMLAEPSADLLQAAEAAGDETTPTSYSDAVGPGQRRAYIARYDGDFDVPDPDVDGDGNPFTVYQGLLWISVEDDTGRSALSLHPIR